MLMTVENTWINKRKYGRKGLKSFSCITTGVIQELYVTFFGPASEMISDFILDLFDGSSSIILLYVSSESCSFTCWRVSWLKTDDFKSVWKSVTDKGQKSLLQTFTLMDFKMYLNLCFYWSLSTTGSFFSSPWCHLALFNVKPVTLKDFKRSLKKKAQ